MKYFSFVRERSSEKHRGHSCAAQEENKNKKKSFFPVLSEIRLQEENLLI